MNHQEMFHGLLNRSDWLVREMKDGFEFGNQINRKILPLGHRHPCYVALVGYSRGGTTSCTRYLSTRIPVVNL